MDLSKYTLSFSQAFVDLYNSTDPKLLSLEGIGPENLDIPAMAHRYFMERPADMSIDSNANVNDGKSYGNYLSEVSKGWLKLQGYYDLYNQLSGLYGQNKAGQLMQSVWNGDFYFHDSTAIQVPYCWAYSTYFLLHQGNFWGQLKSAPPKRRSSFLDQVKEVTIEIAQQVAGAVALGDVFVNYSYFAKKDGLDLRKAQDRKLVENDFQSLVHTLNKKLRPSHQSPFTNFSIFDRASLEYLFAETRFPDGSKADFDFIEETQKIFCDWFAKGDPSTGLPYRFPVVTLNLRVDENRQIIDQKSFDYFSRINLEKGCFNIYISSGTKIASCCRLVNDFELAGCDSFGNGGISLGSHRIVSLNLARLGFLASDFDDVLRLLKSELEAAKDLLVAHRALLLERVQSGFLKFFNYGVMSLERMFSTFGISGVYECLESLGYSMTTEEGIEKAKIILEAIRVYSLECAKKYKYPFNVEQVPAESLAVKFAAKDQYMYDMKYPIYSNQFVPLWVDYDIVDRVKLDGEFSKVLTGGGISHLNVGEKLTSHMQMRRLIEYAVKSGCEHFAINYNFCKCAESHITVAGPSKTCSICGEKIIDQYTRIIGYFTPVSAWNKGRQVEHGKRVFKNQDGLSVHSPKEIEKQTPSGA
jgi:ribonucleoside-triphosphate reductase (formate)